MRFVYYFQLVSGVFWLLVNSSAAFNAPKSLPFDWIVYLTFCAISIGITLIFKPFTENDEKNIRFVSANPLANYGLLFNSYLVTKLLMAGGETYLESKHQFLLLAIVCCISAFKYSQEKRS